MKKEELWLKAEVETLKSEKENLEQSLEEAEEILLEQVIFKQKLKDFIETKIYYANYYKQKHTVKVLAEILNKMQELEGEDE